MGGLLKKARDARASKALGSEAYTGIDPNKKSAKKPGQAKPIKRVADVHIGGVRTPLSVD